MIGSSNWHVALHPSPERIFPSSHCSSLSRARLPQARRLAALEDDFSEDMNEEKEDANELAVEERLLEEIDEAKENRLENFEDVECEEGGS